MRWTCPLLALMVAVPATALAGDPLAESIDRHVTAQLQAEGVTPAARATDAALARRLYLDLVGRIPSHREVKDFVADSDSEKTVKLVDRLMASPEFVDQMATEFDVFMTGGEGGLQEYLKSAFRDRYGWDRVFRECLLGDANDETQKQALEFTRKRVGDLDKLTNEVSVVFFGVNVSCAKCHDHPLVEDWTQHHFYGMKSFFNRTFDNGGFLAERAHGKVQFQTTEGETKPASLMFLTGTTIDEPHVPDPDNQAKKQEKARFDQFKKDKKPAPLPEFSRRAQLVKNVLESGENGFFSRSIVNRVWHQFIGYGLVMPLDQMHSENPASHPELLDELAADMREHGYDLRRLIRGVVLSDTYARGSQWSGDERPYEHLFAVANVRPLSPTQYARSLSLAAGDPRRFEGELSVEEINERSKNAAGTGNRNWFEQPGEAFAISATEALQFTNGPSFESTYLRGGLFNKLKDVDDNAELISIATWNVLSRPPTDEELKLLGDYLSARGDRRESGIQQVLFALLAGTELRFNH